MPNDLQYFIDNPVLVLFFLLACTTAATLAAVIWMRHTQEREWKRRMADVDRLLASRSKQPARRIEWDEKGLRMSSYSSYPHEYDRDPAGERFRKDLDECLRGRR